MGSLRRRRWSRSTWTARGRGAPAPTELFGPAGTPRVVIVGAGFGGIAAGVKLKQAGKSVLRLVAAHASLSVRRASSTAR